MRFKLSRTDEAAAQLERLERDKSKAKKLKKVRKTLGLMETNLKHPSLNTHKYSAMQGPRGEEIFESYVENKTPAAFRVFWHYGPKRGEITVVTITPHP